MVGKTIKKYASEKGLTVKNGLAYGVYHGFMITLNEGSGWKALSVAVSFNDENSYLALGAYLSDADIRKCYRISSHQLNNNSFTVMFFDKKGTMDKISEFADALCSKLTELGGLGADYCSSCKMPLDSASAVKASMNNTVYLLHEGCFTKDKENFTIAKETIALKGSVPKGIVGALLGAAIGAIPWAIAYYYGWFVALLGLVIGLAAKKGYELLGGKESRAKGIVLIAATIFGVFLGESMAIIYVMYSAYTTNPEYAAYSITLLDTVRGYFAILFTSSELMKEVLGDVLFGLVFAALGMYQIIVAAFKSTGKKANTLTKLD